MRLIRSVFRPANDGVSLQFRRCQDIQISCLHPVLNKTSNSVCTSKLRCNNPSYSTHASTSAASSALEDRKPQKRISKSERRTMVENYVNKYREKSEGKFPSPSDVRKDVGGSYYVVRQILQEMIYHSKLSSIEPKDTSLEESTRKNNEMIFSPKMSDDSMDIFLEKSTIKNREMVCNSKEQSMCTNDTSLEKSAMKEENISTKFEEVSQTRELGKRIRPILKGSENSSSMNFQSKQTQQSSVSDDTVEPKDVGAQSNHPIEEIESLRNQDYENKVKPEIVVDLVKSNECKAGSRESTEISERRLHEVPPQEAEAQKISSLWNNLKSYANGIFSIWKRS